MNFNFNTSNTPARIFATQPKRKAGSGSDIDGQPDIQDVLKDELGKLQREYRVLEKSRHNFTHQEGGAESRTRHLITLLEQDRKELRRELKITRCPSHNREVRKYELCMHDILQSYDKYRQDVARTLKQIHETEMQVDKITEKLVKQKHKLAAIYGPSTSVPQREWKLQKAEDRLYNYTCACNIQINENKKLREEINNLLRGRDHFFHEHGHLKLQLALTREKMLRVVQQAIQTYDARDEYIGKLKFDLMNQTVREREAKESKLFGLELQELKRNLHHFNKFFTFVITKCKTRKVFENSKQKRMRQTAAKEKELDNILRKYKTAFQRILEYSKSRSILDLVEKFKKYDFRNFESFKYLSNINQECEVLREAIEIMKAKIEATHMEVEALKQEQREAQTQLQLEIISRDTELTELEKQKEKNTHKVEDFLQALQYAFDWADCDTSLLGHRTKIDKHNYRLCLYLLDVKITEMKHDIVRLYDLLSGEKIPSYHKSKLHSSQGGPFFPKVIMTTKNMDDEDAKILEQEPFYYDEIREFLYLQMVDEGLIDPTQRIISVVPVRSTVSQYDSRHHLSLVEKVKIEGRRQRHTEQFNSRMEMEIREKRIGSRIFVDPDRTDHSPIDHNAKDSETEDKGDENGKRRSGSKDGDKNKKEGAEEDEAGTKQPKVVFK